MEKKTIMDLPESSARRPSDSPFLREKTGKRLESAIYFKVHDPVYKKGVGFVSLDVWRRDNIALLDEGRDAWVIGELAVSYTGVMNASLSIKLEKADDLLLRLVHADVKYAMVSGQQLKKIRAVKDKLPAVRKIIVPDELAEYRDRETPLSEMRRMRKIYLDVHLPEEFPAIGQSLGNDDYATTTYTSGTTAGPKSMILTHRNYMANVEQVLTYVDIDDMWRTLVVLLLGHCFAHVVGFYIFMSEGASVATAQVGRIGTEILKNIPTNIKGFKPYPILNVLALVKNFEKSIEQGIRVQGRNAVRLFNLALWIGYIYSGDSDEEGGKGSRVFLKPLIRLFNRLLFTKVHENLEGELRFSIGGDALLDRDSQKLYYALGIPMYQGYGLSEVTLTISTSDPCRHIFGNSGVLVRPLDLKIYDTDGNVLLPGKEGGIVIRGEDVMVGYWKSPTSTADTVKRDWLYTGDMGYMCDGLLYVLECFKSLLVGSDGEKYSPEGIKEVLIEHSFCIDQLILHNNRSPYTTASLILNKKQLRKCLVHQNPNLMSDRSREEVVRIIQRQIDRLREGNDLSNVFPDHQLPITFTILPELFTKQSGMANSITKIVRGEVGKTHVTRIAQLYAPKGENPLNKWNRGASWRRGVSYLVPRDGSYYLGKILAVSRGP